MAKRDYYDVLGVAKNAGADEIRKAHRKLVRQFHPDVNKSNPSATEKFKEVQEAYDVLSDPQKKARYDQFGHAGVGAAPPGGGGPGGDPFEAFRRAQSGRRGGGPFRWEASPNVSVEDFDLGGGDFGSVFEQLFGGGRTGPGMGAGRGTRGGARGRAAEPIRGADVEHAVTLTFAQAARGTTLPLQINRDGHVETIEVKIPAGVKDGSRIRIRGRGQEGPGGAGDLFIIAQVAPHPYYRREGLDIYMDLPISMYEALLGTKVTVPTLDGPVTLTVPPGTSSGAKLRIRERGAERGGEKGDQFCVVKVIVPKGLDEEEKRQVQRLAEKHPVDARAEVRW